jgi:hypothetical protein
MPPLPPERWADILGYRELEQRYRIPLNMLLAVNRQESAGNPSVVSPAGAVGLFQLMPATARSYGVDPRDPLQAAPAAAQELGSLHKKYDADLARTLAGWNWGQGNVDRKGMDRAPAETRNFIATVGSEVEGKRSVRRTPARERESEPPALDVQDFLQWEASQASGKREASPTTDEGPAIDVEDFIRWEQAQTAGTAQAVPQEPSSPGAGEEGAQTPSDVIATIEKTSPSVPGAPVEPSLGTRVGNVLNQLGERIVARTLEAAKLPADLGLEMGGGIGGSVLGAKLGGAIGGVPGAIGGGILGGVVGGGVGQRAAQTLGVSPPQQPILQTDLVNLYPGDVLGTVASVAPVVPRLAKGIIAKMRAGRAVSKAEQETLEQAMKYTREYDADYRAWANEMAKREAAALQQTTKDLAAHEAQETAGRREWTRNMALADAAEADERAARVAVEQAQQQHAAAVQRLQALPKKYEPAVPARTVDDVRRDMAILDQGGPAADDLIQQLGADDIFDASTKLSQEGDTLLRQGGTASAAGEAIPPSYRQPGARAAAPEQDPLLTMIRQPDAQGRRGINLTDEALRTDWEGVIRNKETDTAGLLNNQSGKRVQDVANDAYELGLIDSADTDVLRRAIDERLAGRLTGSPSAATPDAPVFPPDMPAPRPAASRRPQRASQVLYQRLDDMAGTAPVDLSPAHEAAQAVQAQLLESMPSMQDTVARRVVKDLAEGSVNGSVAQVHQALKDLGPYLRGNDPTQKHLVGQIVDGLQDALEKSAKLYPETAKGLDLMKQARGAWRQERAVEELQRVFRTSGPVVTQTASGELKMDVAKLLNTVENLIAGERGFKGSFTSRGGLPLKDLMDLRQEIKSFIGTPELPKGPLSSSKNVPPRVPPPVPTPPPPPTQALLTPGPPYQPPAPVEPTLRPPTLGDLGRRVLGAITAGTAGGGAVGGWPGAATGALLVSGALVTADVGEYLISRALLTPKLRPLVLSALKPNGTIDPRVFGVLAGAMNMLDNLPAEDKEPEKTERPKR